MSEISKSYQGASVDGAQWLESNEVMNTQKLQKNLRLSESVGAMIAEEARRLTAATGRPWPKNAVVAGAMAIFHFCRRKRV